MQVHFLELCCQDPSVIDAQIMTNDYLMLSDVSQNKNSCKGGYIMECRVPSMGFIREGDTRS